MMLKHAGRSESVPVDDAPAWIAGLLPDDLFNGPVDVVIDRDEILVVGPLTAPTLADDASAADVATAEAGRISGFRGAHPGRADPSRPPDRTSLPAEDGVAAPPAAAPDRCSPRFRLRS